MIEGASDAIPIFFISFNRGTMLKKSIDGVRRQSRPVRIFVQDNASTDEETLDILSSLAADEVDVHHCPAIEVPDDLNAVWGTISKVYDGAPPMHYAVTDCDIDLSVASRNALDVYEKTLEVFPDIEVSGPMLRISDIPRTYKLRNRVLNRHIDQFWRHPPRRFKIGVDEIYAQKALIDTTFALHRAGTGFRRLRPGMRLYEPFEALHLDWYLLEEDVYSATSHQAISHWNNCHQTKQYETESLQYDGFYVVEDRGDGYSVFWNSLASSILADGSRSAPKIA